ncbi:MAG: hypothetical protein G8345_18180 [Magnetococcales bacterium]|nr:hypothetical protein [Magnetococcales bacterium]
MSRSPSGESRETGAHPLFFAGVFLTAGAIIALQITVMRLFAISGWAHFGSLVVSVAMFGFGVASTVMCLWQEVFEREAERIARYAFFAFGPLMVLGNALAQDAQFNPIFLLADKNQQWKLLANFSCYAAPFLAGALLLGIAFLVGRRRFQFTYAADMTGSGVAGLACLASMMVLPVESLLLLPLALWWAGAICWFLAWEDRRSIWKVSMAAVVALGLLAWLPQIQVSPYKGVSYATKFPDSQRIYRQSGTHGLLELYASSYFHFAPGLSDMASLAMEELPENAYLGMYMDSDGPIGVMKNIPESRSDYYHYLPMSMAYLARPQPEQVFISQFGGGISTRVALASGTQHVTVAEGNPMILDLFANQGVRDITGNLLADPRITVRQVEGHLAVRQYKGYFDVVDLSLADSTGLSSPGGFAVTEKYLYTQQAIKAYMESLKPGGVLAVTVWNKEDPPKSTLRLFATLAAAGREQAGEKISDSFFVAQVFLSTATVLYKEGGFTPKEIALLNAYCREMAFDVVYQPGDEPAPDGAQLLAGFRSNVLKEGETQRNTSSEGSPPNQGEVGNQTSTVDYQAITPDGEESSLAGPDLSVNTLYRFMLDRMIRGREPSEIQAYPFDIAPLTDDRPYFAGFVRFDDLPRFFGRFEAISDEWGYLLLWATLGQAGFAGLLLLSLPAIFGWRTVFAPQPGKMGILGFFFSLGLGYILVEVSLIGKFISVLGNAVISTGVLITGMLISTGLGSLYATRIVDRAREVMPSVFLAIALILALYGAGLAYWLPSMSSWPGGWRMTACFLLLFPPAFLMGFPFSTGMTWLARLGKEPFFLWAWGINGMFSVMGAVLVPIVAVNLGLSANLYLAAGLYLMAWPCFNALLRPSPAVSEGQSRGAA